MMTQDDQQNDATMPSNSNRSQQAMMNKYDEQNVLNNSNKMDMHPSRAFKMLQDMTSAGGNATVMTTTVTHTGQS